MSLRRKTDLDRVTEILAYLKSQVELFNPGNFTDINIYAENFYRDFLNIVFGYNLTNINILEPNSAAIDLGDASTKLAIQVTSTSDLSKIRKTVAKFISKDLHTIYDRLIIFNICMKKDYQVTTVGDEKTYQLDTSDDVWDVSHLIKTIGNLSVDKISGIRKFLENEISMPTPDSVSTEIQTFQALIGLLSDENHHAVGGGYIETPDPKGKIEERFSDHTDFLKSEFQELFSEYGNVLKDVRSHADLGQVKLRRLSFHLKTYSDQVLSQCGGNPKLALAEIAEGFETQLAKCGTAYDKTAIRFFLIDELIRCNVFPNKELISA